MSDSNAVVKIPRSFLDQDRRILERCFRDLDLSFRLNTRKDCVEIREEKKGSWERLDDPHEAGIRQRISEECFIQRKHGSNELFPVKMSLERWSDALKGIYHKARVDPFLEWLKALPAWDGVPRLDRLLDDNFETSGPEELKQFAARVVILASIKRAYHPGWKFDLMIVLYGPQGCGKSTFWKELLPESEMFSDSLDLAAGTKERAEQLSGKVIVESAELRGMSRAELNSLKAFISRNSDDYRAAYDRRKNDHKRRSVLVGSTNDPTPLPNDSSGNRRFLVLPVNAKHENNATRIKEYLDSAREQIWAEAMFRKEEHSQLFIPDSLLAVQSEENEKFRSSPNELMEIAVQEHAENYPGGEHTLKEIAFDVYDKLKKRNPDNRDHAALQAALNQIGATRVRKRVHGKPARLYVLPG